jgi:predicted exporter
VSGASGLHKSGGRWRSPASPGRFVAVLAPVVFAVEFVLALVGYAGDWVTALAIAAIITPVTVGLIVLSWQPSPEPTRDE